MACDGTRIFLLGGLLSPNAQVDDTKPIHVLDTSVSFLFVISFWTASMFETELLIYPEFDSGAAKHSEKATQLTQEPSAGQPQRPTFFSSDPDVHAEHSTSSVQKVTPREFARPASLRITRDQTPGPNDLPLPLPGINSEPRRVAEEAEDSEGSTEHHARLGGA